DTLQIIALHRATALRTWTAEFPSSVVPQTDNKNPMDCPFITDCALMTKTASQGNNAWIHLEYAPGEHDVVTLLPSTPDKCTIDGNPIQVQRDAHWRTTRLHISTPPLPLQPVKLTDVKYWVEKFDPSAGEWLNHAPSPLEKLGPVPYGYVKYRAQFESRGSDKLFVDALTADGMQVFLNGKGMGKLSKPAKSLSIDLAGHVGTGSNLLEISYEAFGSANFGPEIQELKGIQSIRLGTGQESSVISPIQIQRFPAALRGRDLNQDYSGSSWQAAQLGASSRDDLLTPNFTWLRAEFPLSSLPGWFAPWKATIEADRDALLYLNGKFMGRYSMRGPQKEFYLPEPYLFLDGKQSNILTVVLAYTADPQHLKQLEVSPYPEFATRQTEIQFHWEW
ncbi:MAG: beta galactosidase jelly roll domain-containing protein, partial [Terriglobia bacterium]